MWRLYPSCYLHGCPCGYLGDKNHVCECGAGEIKRYTRKLSGPLLDRIDLHIRVSRVEYTDLHSTRKAEPSAAIRQRVVAARLIEQERLRRHGLFCNAQMNHKVLHTGEGCRESAGSSVSSNQFVGTLP
nr:MAG TPA: putative ATPase [Caudoviricetes sp.]